MAGFWLILLILTLVICAPLLTSRAQIDETNVELYDSRLRINHLEDVLRALLDDDNEATRADAQRALECS
jgi:hypothetical protein